MARKQAESCKVYTLKITLKGSKPPIWRRVQVLGSTTLGELHNVIQVAMGWENCHLHEFMLGRERFGSQQDADFDDGPDNDEYQVSIQEVLRSAKQKLRYIYDFGDDWDHEILVESIADADPNVRYPICTAGKRASPPEDCGGLWGYYTMLKVLQDPKHEEYGAYTEWLGEDFDPDAFAIEEVNKRLKQFNA